LLIEALLYAAVENNAKQIRLVIWGMIGLGCLSVLESCLLFEKARVGWKG
jgi:hypothetical protein